MSKIFIDIEGPGGVIDFEVKTILDALSDTGCKITLDAPYYEEPSEEQMTRMKQHRNNIDVVIKVTGIPWGG